MTNGPPHLDYAPPPSRWHRWCRRARWWVVLAVLGASSWWAGPPAYRAARLAYLQWACGRYAAPADTVVCDEPGRWGGKAPPFLAAAADPEPLAALARLDPQTYGGPAAGFLGLSPTPTPTPAGGALLFLHWRTTPGGRTRLLIVRRVAPDFRQSWDAPVAFHVAAVARSGGPWSVPPADRPQFHFEVVPQVFADDPGKVAVRFFAGQPDGGDPSRFTVGFEADGQPGTVVGRLVDADDPPGGVRVELTTQ